MTSPVPPETGAYLLHVPARPFRKWSQHAGLDALIHSLTVMTEDGWDLSSARVFEYNYRTGSYDRVDDQFISSRVGRNIPGDSEDLV